MKKSSDKKGFTLIEMLVVIAIIAVLVAIIIPVVVSSTTKANAATDAANLRSVMGEANTLLMMEDPTGSVLKTAKIDVGDCKSFPGADIQIMYVNPGFIKIFYELNDKYYSLDYFAEVAESGHSDITGITKVQAESAKDVTSSNPKWYNISHPENDSTEDSGE